MLRTSRRRNKHQQVIDIKYMINDPVSNHTASLMCIHLFRKIQVIHFQLSVLTAPPSFLS